jgi:hypothetical protein
MEVKEADGKVLIERGIAAAASEGRSGKTQAPCCRLRPARWPTADKKPPVPPGALLALARTADALAGGVTGLHQGWQ